MSAFEELGVSPELIRAADEQGWLLPTPVQAEAVPLVLGGGDVLAAAETGSGKTGAFGLPALQLVHELLRRDAVRAAAPTAPPTSGGAAARAPSSAPPRPRMSEADRSPLLAARHDASLGVSVVQARSERQWAGARASVGVLRGAFRFEARVADEGLVRVGWSAAAASLEGFGTDPFGFGFGGTGKKSNAGKFEAYGEPFGKGDVIGCFIDRTTTKKGGGGGGKGGGGGGGEGSGTIRFSKNGVDLGVAFEIPARLANRALFPTVAVKNAECEVRFDAPFAHDPPDARRIERSGGSNDESSNGLRTVFEPIAAAAPGDAATGGAEAEAEEWTEAETASSRDGRDRRSRDAASRPRTPRALVLEPARDLAEQTSRFFAQFSRYLVSPKPRVALFVGGDDRASQRSMLSGSGSVGVDVAVGTPGRVLDLVEAGDMDLGRCGVFILDEADRLLDAGMAEAIAKIRARLPARARQTLMFSATLHSPEVRRLADATCRADAHWIDLKGKDAGALPETVHHAVVAVDARFARAARRGRHAGLLATLATDRAHEHDGVADAEASRPDALEVLLDGTKNDTIDARARALASLATQRFKPLAILHLLDAFAPEQCLVFCRTNHDCDLLEALLRSAGGGSGGRGSGGAARESGPQSEYSCAVLGASRSTAERRENLRAFKEGAARILVCTDVAARGLDVAGLPFVINATLPDRPEEYAHRVGRVGRADALGLAVSVVARSGVSEKVWYCEKKGYKPWLDPSAEDCERHVAWIDEGERMRDIERTLFSKGTEGAGKGTEGAGGGSGGSKAEGFEGAVASKAGSLPAVLSSSAASEANEPPSDWNPLKAALDALRRSAGLGEGAYGRRKDAEAEGEALRARLDAYAPEVRRLAELEVEAQASFWSLKRKFAGA